MRDTAGEEAVTIVTVPGSEAPSSGRVIWLTGVPASGKTTVANGALAVLRAAGIHACTLDGDVLRRGLSSDLGYSREQRREAVRRAAHVAHVLSEQGQVVLVALVSPYADDRAAARALFPAGTFMEVYVHAPLATCRARDPKGHYSLSAAGGLSGLTGVDSPYEPPSAPELALDTAFLTPAECVDAVVALIVTPGATLRPRAPVSP